MCYLRDKSFQSRITFPKGPRYIYGGDLINIILILILIRILIRILIILIIKS